MVIKYRLRAWRRKYPKGLKKAFLEAIYQGFSNFNEEAYRKIISQAPESKTPNKRFQAGFVKGHIKLLERKTRGGYHYKVVGIPGASNRGSRARRAWLTILALHYGWQKIPFTRKPTRSKVLVFPATPGMVFGEERKAYKAWALQVRQIKKNPWIARVWEDLEPEFRTQVSQAFENIRRRNKKEKIS